MTTPLVIAVNGASPPEPKPAVQTDTQLEPSSAQQRSEAKPPGALHEVTSMASPLMSSAVHPSHRQPSALMYEASALYEVGIGMSGGPSPASWSRLPRPCTAHAPSVRIAQVAIARGLPIAATEVVRVGRGAMLLWRQSEGGRRHGRRRSKLAEMSRNIRRCRVGVVRRRRPAETRDARGAADGYINNYGYNACWL